jgi:hypothetical protein
MMQTEQKALSLWRIFESVIRKTILSIVPNFDRFDQVVFGKIIKVNISGGRVDDRAKGISADVQVLKQDFDTDTDYEVIKDVPFDSALFGTAGGAFSTPPVGAIVRMGFMYNSPLFPFIVSVTNEGKTVPAATDAEYRIETSAGDTVRIKGGEITLRIKNGPAFQVKGGKVKFKTGTYNSDLDVFINKFIAHTHLSTIAGTPTGLISASTPPIIPADFMTGDL